jgi:hypothetical protein
MKELSLLARYVNLEVISGIRYSLKQTSSVDLGLPSFVVNYNDITSLIKFLEEHKVGTIISAFGINATSLSRSQANLIKAADASSVTKRFIPSSFAIRYPRE